AHINSIGKCALSDKCVVKIAGAPMPLDPLSIGLIRTIRDENSKGGRPIRRPDIYRWLTRNLGWDHFSIAKSISVLNCGVRYWYLADIA
ncbi:MAG: hypothetical protein WCD25_10100, partial [Pseudolabrys sp.]